MCTRASTFVCTCVFHVMEREKHKMELSNSMFYQRGQLTQQKYTSTEARLEYRKVKREVRKKTAQSKKQKGFQEWTAFSLNCLRIEARQ